MIKMKYTNPEEARLMILYEQKESEKRGYSLGNDGYTEWVKKFATIFRNWVNTIPENCINCGLNCQRDTTECVDPFNSHRIQYLHKNTIQLY